MPPGPRRYATTGPPQPPTPGTRRTPTATRLRDILDRGWAWALTRDPDGLWSLRALDTATGHLNPPRDQPPPPGHTSPRPMDEHDATAWARATVEVDQWLPVTDERDTLVDELLGIINDITWRPDHGRVLSVLVADDPAAPDHQLVTCRQVWTAAVQPGPPLLVRERGGFATDGDLLAWVADTFGLDPLTWTPAPQQPPGGREWWTATRHARPYPTEWMSP